MGKIGKNIVVRKKCGGQVIKTDKKKIKKEERQK